MADNKDDNKPCFKVIDGDTGDSQEQELHEGVNDEAVELKISQLELEHRDLDQAILTMEERMPYDRLTLMRMKKRKLAIKDKITQLRENTHPDIIA